MGGQASRSIRRKFRGPNSLAPSTDLSPNGSLRPNGYLAVTASSVRESALARLCARFWLTWTRYAPLSAPQYQNSNFAFKVTNDLQSTCLRSLGLQHSQDASTSPHKGLLCTPQARLPTRLLGFYDLQRPHINSYVLNGSTAR
jgi:hypothetical protein